MFLIALFKIKKRTGQTPRGEHPQNGRLRLLQHPRDGLFLGLLPGRDATGALLHAQRGAG